MQSFQQRGKQFTSAEPGFLNSGRVRIVRCSPGRLLAASSLRSPTGPLWHLPDCTPRHGATCERPLSRDGVPAVVPVIDIVLRVTLSPCAMPTH